MKSRRQMKNIIILLIGIFLVSNNFSYSQRNVSAVSLPIGGNVYINTEMGSDMNSGTKDSPIRSLYEAARRVNEANGKGAITIYLSDGIYNLDATVTFHPVNWFFSKTERLTIRAESLPDDAEWN